jgi:two-component system phosphate regulon sensor histidine kinase PhoR
LPTEEAKVTNDVDAIRILVVDDERDIREGSERILKRIGFIVHIADRGDVALKIVKEVHPAIVLLDLKMPGMDGMEVLEHVHQMDEGILVIVVTGYATVETAITAMKQGAYDFIPKPFEPDQLRIVVNRAAEKIRLTRDARKLEEEKTRTLSDLDTEKSRIRTIIESLPDGVLVTNASGKVVLINPSCKQLLNLDPDMGPGRQIEDYVQDESLSKLVMEISKGKHVDYGDIPDHEFNLAADTYLRARAQPVLGERKECLGAVLNFVDISTMKVLDRLKSEFVAKVSHELRSPLSTIHEQLAMVIGDLVNTAPAASP